MTGLARALLPALAVLLACSKADEKPKPPVPAAGSAEAAARPSAAVSAARPAPPPDPVCRALSVVGEGKVGDTALRADAVIDGSEWVSLERGAKLTLKHSTTGRELAVAGPARFRACRRGREQLLLAQGTVTSAAGAGARPGAEVLIATPVAAVHYADAELTLRLDARALELSVRAGSVDVEPMPPPAQPNKNRLSARDKLVLPLGKPDTRKLMAECKSAAEEAQARARHVTDRSAAEPLGERAQAHVRARKAARGRCMVAAAATGLVADPVLRAGFWAEAVEWEALWESVPRRAGSGPEK